MHDLTSLHSVCRWGRTISMNAALCKEIGSGAFPTPRQVLEAGPEALQSKCGVGYRAKTICGLAQQVSICYMCMRWDPTELCQRLLTRDMASPHSADAGFLKESCAALPNRAAGWQLLLVTPPVHWGWHRAYSWACILSLGTRSSQLLCLAKPGLICKPAVMPAVSVCAIAGSLHSFEPGRCQRGLSLKLSRVKRQVGQ